LSRKTSTSLGVTELAISISAVRSIFPRCMRSNIPFARRFLIVIGLRFIPYDLYRYLKCCLNSLLLWYQIKTPWISTQPGFVYQFSYAIQGLIKNLVSC
jgi:hypothetical protein